MERENPQGAPYGGPASTSTFPPFYDTHAGVRRLTQAGVEESLAEAMVSEQLRVVGQNVASHADIARLENEIMRLRQDVRGEIESVRGEVKALDGKVEVLDGKVNALDGKVNALDGEVKALAGKVEALDGKIEVFRQEIRDIKGSQTKILQWGAAQTLTVILFILGAFQLL